MEMDFALGALCGSVILSMRGSGFACPMGTTKQDDLSFMSPAKLLAPAKVQCGRVASNGRVCIVKFYNRCQTEAKLEHKGLRQRDRNAEVVCPGAQTVSDRGIQPESNYVPPA